MLLFLLNQTIILYSIIKSYLKINNVMIMQITKDEIFMQSIETNNNIMVSTHINSNVVLSLLVQETIQLHFNTLQLYNVLRHCNNKSVMEFYYFKKNNSIGIKLIEKFKIDWFELKLEYIEIPVLLMDHLQYYCNFQFHKQDIIHLCSTFLTMNQNIIIKVLHENLFFIIHSTLFTGTLSFKNHALKPFGLNNHFNKEFHSKYWIILKNLLIMTNNIIISFNNDKPVKIHIIHEFGITDVFILSIDLYD